MAVKAIIFDTNAYSALTKGDLKIKRVLKSAERLALPIVVIGELLAGFRYGTREERNREQLFQILASEDSDILFVDMQTAEHYASIFTELRRKGRPIPTNDIWIAALARQYDLPICSLDSDFEFVEGLTLIRDVSDFHT